MENNNDIIEHINNITDKNNPIFKTIGYYLCDQECVEELKEYLSSRISIMGFLIILLVNILLVFDIGFVFISHYVFLMKFFIVLFLLMVDYFLINKYKNYLALSYSYRVLYCYIQKVPIDILKKTYYRIINKGKV